MLANHRFVGSPVNAMNLVVGDVALDPLSLRTLFTSRARRVRHLDIRHAPR